MKITCPTRKARRPIFLSTEKRVSMGEAPLLTFVFGSCPVGEAVWVEWWKPVTSLHPAVLLLNNALSYVTYRVLIFFSLQLATKQNYLQIF